MKNSSKRPLTKSGSKRHRSSSLTKTSSATKIDSFKLSTGRRSSSKNSHDVPSYSSKIYALDVNSMAKVNYKPERGNMLDLYLSQYLYKFLV